MSILVCIWFEQILLENECFVYCRRGINENTVTFLLFQHFLMKRCVLNSEFNLSPSVELRNSSCRKLKWWWVCEKARRKLP